MTTPLTRAYMGQLHRLRVAAAGVAVARWNRLPDYDDEGSYIAEVAPRVATLQREASAITSTYLAMAVATARRSRTRPTVSMPADLVTTPALRGGITDAQLWHRPFMELRMALDGGTPWREAVTRAGARAGKTAATNTQLAMQRTTAYVAPQLDGITGYRRVLRGDTCPLCQRAATRRYRTDQLMPLHPGCNCGVEPIVDGRAEAPAPAPPEDAPEVQVFEHDELGPTLLDASHAPTPSP